MRRSEKIEHEIAQAYAVLVFSTALVLIILNLIVPQGVNMSTFPEIGSLVRITTEQSGFLKRTLGQSGIVIDVLLTNYKTPCYVFVVLFPTITSEEFPHTYAIGDYTTEEFESV